MKLSEITRRTKISFLIGLGIVPVVIALFIYSADRQLALKVLAGPELRAVVGDVKFSYPSSFKIRHGDQRGAQITYYVVGTRKRGFLTVMLENSIDGLYVKSATFDGAPLVLQSAHSHEQSGT